jgi:hypothetical protein
MGDLCMKNKIVLTISLFVVTFALTGLAAAENILLEDPVLWVVPENPNRYISSNSDPLLAETVVEDVNMGTTFSGNILVLNQESYEAPLKADALSIKLKFFVTDKSNIKDITIGTAQRVIKGPPQTIIDPNNNSNNAAQTLVFGDYSNSPGPALGYNVSYLIGDIPWSGGASLTGNPQDGLSTFNPYNGSYLIKIPFTIRFKSQPDPGFFLYVFAENTLTGKDWAHTAYSHDGGFYQIPEFPIIAMPIAAVIGLVFFFQQRRKKEE